MKEKLSVLGCFLKTDFRPVDEKLAPKI